MVIGATIPNGDDGKGDSIKTTSQFEPEDWRDAASEVEGVEIFQRMPFFQAMLLVLDHKTKYFSAKVGAVDPDSEKPEIPSEFLGEANFVEGDYKEGEQCLVLAEIPAPYLTQENLHQPNIDDYILGYLPLKMTMKRKDVEIDKISAEDAKGTAFSPDKLKSLLSTQVKGLVESSQEGVHELMRKKAAEIRSHVSFPQPSSISGFAGPLGQQSSVTQAAPQEETKVAAKGYADMFDVQIATPEEMVQLAPDLWPDTEEAQKHLNKIQKGMLDEIEPGRRAMNSHIRNIWEGLSANMGRSKLQAAVGKAEAKLSEGQGQGV